MLHGSAYSRVTVPTVRRFGRTESSRKWSTRTAGLLRWVLLHIGLARSLARSAHTRPSAQRRPQSCDRTFQRTVLHMGRPKVCTWLQGRWDGITPAPKPTSCSFRGFCFTSTSGWGGESCGCVRELKKAESTGRAKLSNYQCSTASPGHSKGPMIPLAVSPRLNSSDEEYGLSDRASSCA